MFRALSYALVLLGMISCGSSSEQPAEKPWVSLFDGKSFDGWQANENPGTFKIEEGVIVVNGPRSHLFYNGKVMDHDFKDFELKIKVMTTPGSNSGIFFHTRYQDTGWPSKGFEVQVNNSHTDWRRTGSIYAIQDVKEVYVKDNEWYDMQVTVIGKKVTVKVNGNVINEYQEPENIVPAEGNEEKLISSGTFALQGHDPDSKVMYKDIMVRPL